MGEAYSLCFWTRLSRILAYYPLTSLLEVLTMTTTGIFVDVVGLSYGCGNTKGTTSKDFIYKYDPGVKVTFSIGDLVLGHCEGRPTTTVSNLVPDSVSIYDPRTVNRARLLFSLSAGQGFETPIHIDHHVRRGAPLGFHFAGDL